MIDETDRISEVRHLQEILHVIDQQLAAARAQSEEQISDFLILQDDFPEQPDQAFQSLGSIDDFEDLATLTQYMQPLSEQQKKQEDTRSRILALEKMAATPYFARLDLRFADDDEEEKIYIGRNTLWKESTNEILIHDWRSPVASLFYRFEPGPAYYDAPAGRIDCQLLRKRQFEIKNGILLYCFDANTAIQDAFLKKMLGQNASPQMKAIVETIQRDQDAATRDEKNELLMVQGVAGSGKTAIALHRVAYLMYEGLKNRLQNHNMLILSPNTFFEKYISGILPELGTSRVNSATFERLLARFLSLSIQPRAQRVDALYAVSSPTYALRRDALAFKSSRAFLQILDRFVALIPQALLSYRDVYYGGRLLVSREEMRNDVLRRGDTLPLGTWLHRYEGTLLKRVHALRPARMDQLRRRCLRAGWGEEYARGYSIYESVALLGQIRAVTRVDSLSLYLRLINDESLFRRLAQDIALPDSLVDVLSASFQSVETGMLPLEDASAVAYLKLRLFGAPQGGDIRQVVVDEAQDYSPIDFSVMNGLFPRARFTIVGDIHQAMERTVGLSFYDEIRSVLCRRASALVTLNKSFRCTREILEFSQAFLSGVHIDSFNRSGDAPRVLPAEQIAQEVSACRAQGLRSIALIAKTSQDAMRWYDQLKPSLDVRLMGRDASLGDLFILPLALSKGLEFDAVFVLDCDDTHYIRPQDARLLYIACTRALHRLSLFYRDRPSALLKGREIADA